MTAAEHDDLCAAADVQLAVIHNPDADPAGRADANAEYQRLNGEMIALNERDPRIITGHASHNFQSAIMRAAADQIDATEAAFREAFANR